MRQTPKYVQIGVLRFEWFERLRKRSSILYSMELSPTDGLKLAMDRLNSELGLPDEDALMEQFRAFSDANTPEKSAAMAAACRGALAALPVEQDPLTRSEVTLLTYSAGFFDALYASNKWRKDIICRLDNHRSDKAFDSNDDFDFDE